MSSTISGRNIAPRAATDKAAALVLRLGEAGDNHRSLVGGKAFNLGKLIAAGLPGPRGWLRVRDGLNYPVCWRNVPAMRLVGSRN